MNRLALLCAACLLILVSRASAQKPFTLEQVLSAPFPADLSAAKKGNRIAWTLNQEGRRNIWVAEGPSFATRQLTKYDEDDGQELSGVNFSADGNTIVYVRGEGSGGDPKRVDAGHSPDISSRGILAYVKDGQIYLASLDSADKPQQLIVRGQNFDAHWSPDGSRLSFVSARGDHAFIGVYEVAAKIVRFIAPSVDSDGDPVWSPDGNRIAFVRRPAEARDTPQGYFIAPDKIHPWAIWVADASAGAAKEIWHSSATPQGSFPYMADDTGGGAINWAADNQLVIASEQDGWQHLYALSVDGGAPKLLTPGNCEVEQWSFTPDKKSVLFNSNCNDTDRRHVWTVSVAGGGASQRCWRRRVTTYHGSGE